MADFDNLNPPKRITDVSGVQGVQEYPRHMHHKDGSYIVIENDKEKSAALKKGYALLPFDNTRADDAVGDDEKK